jgi:hypothetical protein
MTPPLATTCLTLAAFLAGAPAQSVTNARTGRTYLDLPPAIDAASADDLLVLLPGTYSAAKISVPLRLLAPRRATISPANSTSLAVENLPANSFLSVCGLDFPHGSNGTAIRLRNNLGSVHFDDISVGQGVVSSNSGALLTFNCAHVTVHASCGGGQAHHGRTLRNRPC